jgi:hypothetical protein
MAARMLPGSCVVSNSSGSQSKTDVTSARSGCRGAAYVPTYALKNTSKKGVTRSFIPCTYPDAG